MVRLGKVYKNLMVNVQITNEKLKERAKQIVAEAAQVPPEEAGQLFRDIAIAISAAVGLSLLISVTVIPALSSRILGRSKAPAEEGQGIVAAVVAGTVRFINRSTVLRLLVVLGMTGLAIFGSIAMAPEPSYLPSGNRNLVFGFLICPPGYNTNEFERMARIIEDGAPERGIVGARDFWEAEVGTPEYDALLAKWNKIVEEFVIKGRLEPQLAQAEATLKSPTATDEDRAGAQRSVRELNRQIAEWRVPPPPIENFFFVSFGGGCFMGCSSADEELVRPLKNVLTQSGGAVPDVIPIFFQPSIFKTEAGNSVDIEVRGDDLDAVVPAALGIMTACGQEGLGFAEPNPNNFYRDRREDQIRPDRVRAGDLGLTVADLGFIIRACGDGRIVGQYREGGRSIDLTLRVKGTDDPRAEDNATETIANVPIYTPTGHIVPMSAVCEVVRTTAPQEIRHIETQPAVKLTIRPPEGMSLPDVIHIIENDIVAEMRGDGYGAQKAKISESVNVKLAGNADKLVTTWNSMKWLLGLSFLIVFLLMAGLFESFAYPFVIILTVPLAVVGGFAGLWAVHTWTYSDPTMLIQDLDILTILGFVILLGIVVNNGILIVHQSLNFMRDSGMEANAAIAESVRTRVRPILMTVLTTVVGQLMLVVRPGSGAELYRGVGAVVLGGLLVSTVFTLIVVPAMLSLFMGVRRLVWRERAAAPMVGEPAVVQA